MRWDLKQWQINPTKHSMLLICFYPKLKRWLVLFVSQRKYLFTINENFFFFCLWLHLSLNSCVLYWNENWSYIFCVSPFNNWFLLIWYSFTCKTNFYNLCKLYQEYVIWYRDSTSAKTSRIQCNVNQLKHISTPHIWKFCYLYIYIYTYNIINFFLR